AAVTYRCFVGHLKDSGASRHDKPASNFLGFVSSCLCSGQLSFVLSYSVIISFPGPVELKLTFVEVVLRWHNVGGVVGTDRESAGRNDAGGAERNRLRFGTHSQGSLTVTGGLTNRDRSQFSQKRAVLVAGHHRCVVQLRLHQS